MPLDQSKLQRALRPCFASPAAAMVSGRRIAAAYAAYAGSALSCGGGVPVGADLSARKKVLGTALGAAFSAGLGQPITIPPASTAFGLFWMGMAFAGATPGAVTVAATPTLMAGLLAVCAANAAAAGAGGKFGPDKIASQWAKVLHAWTTTSVIAAHVTGPAACAAPIS